MRVIKWTPGPTTYACFCAGDDWWAVDWTDIYISSLWEADTGRAIFQAVILLNKFQTLSRVIRFDDRTTRNAQCETDMLAAIRNVWKL